MWIWDIIFLVGIQCWCKPSFFKSAFVLGHLLRGQISQRTSSQIPVAVCFHMAARLLCACLYYITEVSHGKKMGTRWGHVGSVPLALLVVHCLYLQFIDGYCSLLLWVVLWRPQAFAIYPSRHTGGLQLGRAVWLVLAMGCVNGSGMLLLGQTISLLSARHSNILFLLQWLRRPCFQQKTYRNSGISLSLSPPCMVWHRALHWPAFLM